MAARVPPSLKGTLLLGSLRALQRDPLGTLLDASRLGPVARLRTGPYWFTLVAHPDGLKRVLVDNAKGYRKSNAFDEARPLLGDGLVTAEADAWVRKRRLAQPAFHRERLAGFAEVMVAEARATARAWERPARRGDVVDVAREMTATTLAIVGRTLFSIDLARDVGPLSRAISFAQAHASERLLKLVKPPRSWPTPANLRFRRAVRTMDERVYAIIAERRAARERPEDLLTMLMEADDAGTGRPLTDRELRDETNTFLLAGHDTTANALAWTWALLAEHADVDARLAEELERVLDDRDATFADVPRLPYATRVVQEALRLYPPAWIITRNALADDEVMGYRIPRDSFVAMSPFVTHRLPELWESPERFDPERFLPEREAKRHRLAFVPFGAGPRACIGAQFAMTEAVLVLATLARRYRATLAPGARIEPHAMLTLKPRHGVPVVLHPR